MSEFQYDVLVIGAGCAGMRAAIEAHDAGASTAMLSKLHPTRSHSGAAEGGINAALGNSGDDSPESHAFDTVKGSDYLGDQDAIEEFTREAPGDIYQLEHWGAVFSRNDDGKLAQRPFGAAGSPRTVFSADITGHVLIHVLYEQVMKRMELGNLKVYEEFFAWRLVESDGRCQGVIAWDLLNGGLHLITAKTVILATGGMGRLYRTTTNAYACTGDGPALALKVGVPLKDMEFMQFHPTTLFPTGILLAKLFADDAAGFDRVVDALLAHRHVGILAVDHQRLRETIGDMLAADDHRRAGKTAAREHRRRARADGGVNDGQIERRIFDADVFRQREKSLRVEEFLSLGVRWC